MHVLPWGPVLEQSGPIQSIAPYTQLPSNRGLARQQTNRSVDQRLLTRITLATPNVVIPESIMTIGIIITGLPKGSLLALYDEQVACAWLQRPFLKKLK